MTKPDDGVVAGNVLAGSVCTKTRRGRRLDGIVRRYLPDDCGAFGWIEVAPILQSAIGQKLTERSEFWEECRKQFAPLDLEVEHIERVVFGARSFVDGEPSKFVAVLFCGQPVETSVGSVTADDAEWAKEEIGRLTLWVKRGEEPYGLCAVEDRVVLAGSPESLRAVLTRDGPTELPETLDRARRLLDSATTLAMTILPSASIGGTNLMPFPVTGDLADRVEAVNLEMEFDANVLMRLAAVCRDEAAAEQIRGMTTGLLTLIQMQGLEGQEPEVRDLIRSIRVGVEGPVVTASLQVPSELVNVAKDDSKSPAAPGRLLAPATAACPVGVAPACTMPTPYRTTPSSPTSTPPYPTPSYVPQTAYGAPYASSVAGPQPPSSTVPTLDITDVIRLVEAGVDEEVIIRHVTKHSLAAALTADDLIRLTASEVSVKVITALQAIPVVPNSRRLDATSSQVPPGPRGQAEFDTGSQVLPSRHMTDDVQYFQPGPEFRLAEEAAAQKAPPQAADTDSEPSEATAPFSVR